MWCVEISNDTKILAAVVCLRTEIVLVDNNVNLNYFHIDNERFERLFFIRDMKDPNNPDYLFSDSEIY